MGVNGLFNMEDNRNVGGGKWKMKDLRAKRMKSFAPEILLIIGKGGNLRENLLLLGRTLLC